MVRPRQKSSAFVANGPVSSHWLPVTVPTRISSAERWPLAKAPKPGAGLFSTWSLRSRRARRTKAASPACKNTRRFSLKPQHLRFTGKEKGNRQIRDKVRTPPCAGSLRQGASWFKSRLMKGGYEGSLRENLMRDLRISAQPSRAFLDRPAPSLLETSSLFEPLAFRSRKALAHPGFTSCRARPSASASGGTSRVITEPDPT